MLQLRSLGLSFTMLLTASTLALAQAPTDPAAPQAPEMKQQVQGKLLNKKTCRAQAKSAGMRGADLRNQVKVCQAEARVACEKKAADAHASGPARHEFIDKCLREI